MTQAVRTSNRFHTWVDVFPFYHGMSRLHSHRYPLNSAELGGGECVSGMEGGLTQILQRDVYEGLQTGLFFPLCVFIAKQ